MDNKRVILGTTIGLALILLWQFVAVPLILHSHPDWAKESPKENPTTAPAVAPTSPATTQVAAAGTSNPATGPTTSASATAPTISAADAGLHVVEAKKPGIAGLGSAMVKEPKFAMKLDLRPDGAAVQQVTLNEFKREARFPDP